MDVELFKTLADLGLSGLMIVIYGRKLRSHDTAIHNHGKRIKRLEVTSAPLSRRRPATRSPG